MEFRSQSEYCSLFFAIEMTLFKFNFNRYPLLNLCKVLLIIFFQCIFNTKAEYTAPVDFNDKVKIIGVKEINYDAFYGIPFAKPPVKSLRFAVQLR